MVSSQITLTFSLVFIALFSIAIFGFAIGFANDNNANISIADDSEMDTFYSKTRTNFTDFHSDAEGTYDSIIDTTIEPGSDVAQSSGPFVITFGNVIGVFKNILYIPYKKIFGSGEGFGVFITTFISIIIVVLALLAYKTLRGNP